MASFFEVELQSLCSKNNGNKEEKQENIFPGTSTSVDVSTVISNTRINVEMEKWKIESTVIHQWIRVGFVYRNVKASFPLCNREYRARSE